MTRARPLALLGSLCLALGCAGVKPNASGPGNGGSTGSGGRGNTGAGGGVVQTTCNGPCTDFPTTPIVDGSANGASAAQIFGTAGSGNSTGGPCLFEPESGTLFPNNWLRPRFSWVAPSGQNLFELRIHAANQANDLVVYTTATVWTMNQDDMSNPPGSLNTMWAALASHTVDAPLTVTIRGASANGGTPSVGSSNSFTIAPVTAEGNLVYWSPSGSTNGGKSGPGITTLSGFSVGDPQVNEVLVPSDVQTTWETPNVGWNVRNPSNGEGGPGVSCIGCHTSTPDGNYIGFNDFYPWGGVITSPQTATLGQRPPFMGQGGQAAFSQPWVGIQTYSLNHWTDGPPSEHIVVAPLGSTTDDQNQAPGLAWFDLESTTAPLSPGQNSSSTLKGTAWNWIFPPTGGRYAAAPSWGHVPSDDFIIFTGTSSVVSGRMGTGTAHLYSVPYSKTAQQPATVVPISVNINGQVQDDVTGDVGAQYYGTLSPDDQLIAFDRIPGSTASVTHADLNSSDTCFTSGGQSEPCTWSGMYMQPATELYFVPTAGGVATRLTANDPPQCPGQQASPGINNTWAKWSPQVSTGTGNGNTYYWIVFSSWRQGMKDANGDPIAQLFATAIVKTELGFQTYPAIYLWNQPATISNFTPAWDYFKIPIIIDSSQ